MDRAWINVRRRENIRACYESRPLQLQLRRHSTILGRDHCEG